MKVIDADKFCNFLNRYPLKKAQDNFMNLYRDCLRYICKCEKDAIPVEWLEKKIEKCKSSKDLYPQLFEEIMTIVITEWRKENETN